MCVMVITICLTPESSMIPEKRLLLLGAHPRRVRVKFSFEIYAEWTFVCFYRDPMQHLIWYQKWFYAGMAMFNPPENFCFEKPAKLANWKSVSKKSTIRQLRNWIRRKEPCK